MGMKLGLFLVEKGLKTGNDWEYLGTFGNILGLSGTILRRGNIMFWDYLGMNGNEQEWARQKV